jgi:hypothetical protein
MSLINSLVAPDVVWEIAETRDDLAETSYSSAEQNTVTSIDGATMH